MLRDLWDKLLGRKVVDIKGLYIDRAYDPNNGFNVTCYRPDLVVHSQFSSDSADFLYLPCGWYPESQTKVIKAVIKGDKLYRLTF